MTHRRSLVLFLGGAVLLVIGVLAVSACAVGRSTVCTSTGLSLNLVAIAIALAGVFLLAGGVLAATALPSVYSWKVQGFQTYCPVCGRPLSWVGTTGRWFCQSCREYR